MNNAVKALLFPLVVTVLVVGAYFATKAEAGGGNNTPQIVPFNFFQQQAPVQPTLFDLQREHALTN